MKIAYLYILTFIKYETLYIKMVILKFYLYIYLAITKRQIYLRIYNFILFNNFELRNASS